MGGFPDWNQPEGSDRRHRGFICSIRQLQVATQTGGSHFYVAPSYPVLLDGILKTAPHPSTGCVWYCSPASMEQSGNTRLNPYTGVSPFLEESSHLLQPFSWNLRGTQDPASILHNESGPALRTHSGFMNRHNI